MPITENPGADGGSRFPVAFVVGLVVVSLIVIVFLLATHSSGPAQPSQQPKLPFSAEARSYAGSIQFKNLQLSESSNMLNEKFTYLDGIVANNGSRTIQAMEVLVEFHDPFNQVILRDTRRVISKSNQPLGPEKERAFDLTFEQLPAEWNQQYPTIRVTGLVLQ
jgi:hypothetical protein